MDFSKLFMYIPGVIIFLVGSGQQRSMPGLLKKGGSAEGTVCDCSHVVKKDRQGRDQFNYYNVLVEFRNPESGRKEKRAVKSPTEYYRDQPVRILGIGEGEQIRISGAEEEQVFPPIALMIGGALLILLAYWENNGAEGRAMSCLVLILLGAGALLIARYQRLKARNLSPIEAEIVEVYSRQLSKESKLLKGSRYTYYPVVRYVADGKEALRRCNVNSSGEKTFRVGDHMTLWYDKDRHTVTESHATKGMLIAGVILLALGMVSLAGLIPALLSGV